jgi:dihydrofolate synthase/folylpolyglutamate synthase
LSENEIAAGDYQEALDWLFGLEMIGIKLGLKNITELLHRLDDPQKEFRCVHVAGTKGKGSVSAMLASILRAQGYHCGLYTSPHLVDFRERIVVDGKAIPRKDLVRLTQLVRASVEEMGRVERASYPTFFEVTTAIAFLYFAERGVHLAVIEVGMGGRLDATNVIEPEASVITRLELEHTQYLGATIESIAAEKAGIIKPGTPVVTLSQNPGTDRVIEEIAAANGSSVDYIGRDVPYTLKEATREGTRVLLEGPGEVEVPLLGSYQAENVALAYGAVLALRRRGVAIGDDAVTLGLKQVNWPARLELVGRAPFLIFDVTHTPGGAEVVAREVRRLFPGRIILVLGMLDDKDLNGVAEQFARISGKAIATSPHSSRAFSAEKVERALRKHMSEVERRDSVADAVRTALLEAKPEDTVLVTGSLYTIGEAKAWWGRHETH